MLAPQVEALLATFASVTSILWVEPGTYEASLALIAIRERLRQGIRSRRPMSARRRQPRILAPGNASHWCHHFATPPPGVFTDPFWGRFAQMLGIDLRSVPLSYLVLDRRPLSLAPAYGARRIGRPWTNKVDARFLACTSDGVAGSPVPSPHISRPLARRAS